MSKNDNHLYRESGEKSLRGMPVFLLLFVGFLFGFIVGFLMKDDIVRILLRVWNTDQAPMILVTEIESESELETNADTDMNETEKPVGIQETHSPSVMIEDEKVLTDAEKKAKEEKDKVIVE